MIYFYPRNPYRYATAGHFIKKVPNIYDIIKSEKNIYGVDEETRRTADIVRIVSSGIDFNQIKEWVERGDEGMIAYLITQCGYELLTIFRGQEK